MPRQFEVRFEGELPATPAQAWDACTRYTRGWYWAIDYEPRLGGREAGLTAAGGTVTAWEPLRHFAARSEEENGWWNNVDYVFEKRPGGTFLRFVHTGLFDPSDYDVRYDACRHHTAFYYHSLGEYLRHFADRDARYVRAQGPDESARPGSFRTVLRALGLPESAPAGTEVALRPEGLSQEIRGVVDYRTPAFLGVRTADGLYRFYGRDAWGQEIGLGHHLFAPSVDRAAAERDWQDWLTGLFGARTGE